MSTWLEKYKVVFFPFAVNFLFEVSQAQRNEAFAQVSFEPEPDGERDTKDDGETSEQRVPSTQPEFFEHLAAEKRERETKERPEDGRCCERARCIRKRVDKI